MSKQITLPFDPETMIVPEHLKPLEEEFRTYFRVLPRLVQGGDEGRCVLIKGDAVLSIWDTERDATQAGREKFGLEPICVMKIDTSYIDAMVSILEQEGKKACHS